MPRADLPDRRAGRAGRAPVAEGSAPAAEALVRGCRGAFPTGFMSSCSAIPARAARGERLLTERGHVEMAYARDLPLVATNDVYFPEIRRCTRRMTR
jgi:hypothetical protein